MLVGKTALLVEDGRVTIQAEVVDVGSAPKLAKPVALAEPTRITLEALSKEVALLKSELRATRDWATQFEQRVTTFASTHTHISTTAPVGPPAPSLATLTPYVPQPLLPFISLYDANSNGAVDVVPIESRRLNAE
jgi:hypothetical protein